MTYEQFRDTICKTLRDNGNGMTWTEIRTKAKLTQMFPNNQWVRRMESDIGLQRVKDNKGIMRWQVPTDGGAQHGKPPRTESANGFNEGSSTKKGSMEQLPLS